MKKTLFILMAVCLLLSAACSGGQGGNDPPVGGGNDEPVGGGIQTAAILFDFSGGSPEENIVSITHYSYQDITAEEMIETMSDISRFDFYVTLSVVDNRLVADWSADSTLVAGLDDREQEEDFHFYDADSLRWFMMDSLWRTLGSDEIYYTMDGGKELAFDELYPVNVFPSDLPYMGSAFYFAHAAEADIISDSPVEDGGESIGEDEASDILLAALEMPEGTAVVFSGEEFVDGVHCWTFSYGKNTPEKFTAEAHYAVTDDGRILVYDLPSDEYKEFNSP